VPFGSDHDKVVIIQQIGILQAIQNRLALIFQASFFTPKYLLGGMHNPLLQ
jgi:hypothetical protein